MVAMVKSSSSSRSSQSAAAVAVVVVLAACASQAVLAQESVYVPGNADETPGVALNIVGVGADGMTTYDIGGVQLAENSAQAIMTQYTPQGAIVYNCQLGADAVANCAVQQLYDGAAYSYTEPITYFGQSTGALPAAAAAATSSVDPAATPAATTSPSSSSAPARIVPSSSSTSTRAPSATNGPQTGAVQATSSNVFGGNAAAQDGGASCRAALTKTAGALVAVMAGVAAFL